MFDTSMYIVLHPSAHLYLPSPPSREEANGAHWPLDRAMPYRADVRIRSGWIEEYRRQAVPMWLKVANDVATFDNGEVTGNFPGKFIGPSAPEAAAIAAD